MAITSHVFDDSIQGAIFVLIVVLTPLSVIATALRFLASRASSRTLGAEDWLALGALLFYLGWITIALLSNTTKIVCHHQWQWLTRTVLSTLDGKSLDQLDLDSLKKTLKVDQKGGIDDHNQSR